MNPDDDDNIIRFPTFVRIEGEEPPGAIKSVFRCYVLVNRETAKVPLNDWANASAARHATIRLTGLDPGALARRSSALSASAPSFSGSITATSATGRRCCSRR